jgi:hypothetical protein
MIETLAGLVVFMGALGLAVVFAPFSIYASAGVFFTGVVIMFSLFGAGQKKK